MNRYVQVGTDYWRQTRRWPNNARMLYLWLWGNEYVDGVTGIGEVDQDIVRSELSLSAEEVQTAWDYLTEHDKVMRDGDWYWVKDRANYTCRQKDGSPYMNYVMHAANLIATTKMPQPIKDGFLQSYKKVLGSIQSGSAPHAKGLATGSDLAQRVREIRGGNK